MPNADLTRFVAQAREHAHEALTSLGALPEGVSVARFIADYGKVGDMVHYVTVPDAAAEAVRQVEAAHGADGAKTFLRAALAHGAADLLESGRLDALPPRIVHYHVKHMGHIAGATSANADWMNIKGDLFHKDFGLITLRLFAAAAQHVAQSLGGGHQTMLSSWTRSPAPKRCADIDVTSTTGSRPR